MAYKITSDKFKPSITLVEAYCTKPTNLYIQIQKSGAFKLLRKQPSPRRYAIIVRPLGLSLNFKSKPELLDVYSDKLSSIIVKAVRNWNAK